MIHVRVKLKLSKCQDLLLNKWLWHLTGVWNWAIKKIGNDAKDYVFHSKFDFQNMLANHSSRIEIPSHVLQGMLKRAHVTWSRCYKNISGAPRLKGARNKLNNIPFPDPVKDPQNNSVVLSGLGRVKYFKQIIPKGKIKSSNIIKCSSGWYLCLFIDAEREPIKRVLNGSIGVDPGFNNLLTLSTGETIPHPRELEKLENRIAQAQRGGDKHLAARLQERRANRVKDRNHKLSLRLVQQNEFIAFSKDRHKTIAKTFGKSVSSSSHYQLRQMLAYKSRSGGTQYVEVDPAFSTMTCSSCGARNGPTGLDGLAVRTWVCACGAHHDRDTNAALNTLKSGLGYSLKETSNGTQLTGIPI